LSERWAFAAKDGGFTFSRVAQPESGSLKVSGRSPSDLVFQVNANRVLKQALLAAGYPAEDLAGYVVMRSIQLRAISQAGSFNLRHYQKEAVAFYQAGRAQGGSGVLCCPGAGKRWWIGSHDCCAVNTLVLTSSLTSVRQWRRELLDKTTLPEDAIAEYSGESKQTAPVTLATYSATALVKTVCSRISNCSALAHGLDYLRRSSPVARTHFPDYRRTASPSFSR